MTRDLALVQENLDLQRRVRALESEIVRLGAESKVLVASRDTLKAAYESRSQDLEPTLRARVAELESSLASTAALLSEVQRFVISFSRLLPE